jgi:hypothetical protein
MPRLVAVFQMTKPGEGVPAFGVVLSVLAVAGVADHSGSIVVDVCDESGWLVWLE